jgi:hypothetical protein
MYQTKKIFEFSNNYNALKCSNCSVIISYPMPNSKTLKKFYTGFNYANEKHHKDYNKLAKNILKDLERNNLKVNKILDFGGSIGNYMDFIKIKRK